MMIDNLLFFFSCKKVKTNQKATLRNEIFINKIKTKRKKKIKFKYYTIINIKLKKNSKKRNLSKRLKQKTDRWTDVEEKY